MDGTPPFVFHDVSVGGAEGDATLEFLIKPPTAVGGSPVHSALFWTGTEQPLNLVHVFWNAAPVTNVPDYCVAEVSDHALALILSCARKVAFFNQRAASGTEDTSFSRPTGKMYFIPVEVI